MRRQLDCPRRAVGFNLRGGKYHEWKPKEFAAFRARIGIVFQKFNLFAHQTVLEDVACASIYGDGDGMVCGGAGEFVEWLTIATAYRDVDYVRFMQESGDDLPMLVALALMSAAFDFNVIYGSRMQSLCRHPTGLGVKNLSP